MCRLARNDHGAAFHPKGIALRGYPISDVPCGEVFSGHIVDEEDASGDSIQDRSDAIFDAMTFYNNPENPYVQKLRFTGRFQVDTYSVDLDEGGSDSDWVIRRWRMGFSGTFRMYW